MKTNRGLSGCYFRHKNSKTQKWEPWCFEDLPEEEQYDVFLHELAHARLHADKVYDALTEQRPDFSAPVLQPLRKAVYDEREAEANLQKAVWAIYAKQHAGGSGGRVLRLLALLDMEQ